MDVLRHFPRLAFVDLETSGMSATGDRITELGIVLVDKAGVQQWSSLVHPGMWISEFITSLTGITNTMLQDAPRFAALAEEVRQRLDGCLFIAHNARFDHGFLKNEFKRLGIEFRPKVLCTVKLSRKLYPGFRRHNLDSLIERHRLQVTQRHRALGDALLLWQFWQVIHREFSAEQIEATIQQLTARPALPSYLDQSLIDQLPTGHGVYLFYAETALLYIGKANNLRRRVLSHFSGDHASSKELALSQQVRRIEWIETAGEIGALLKEAQLIKQLSPLHNQQLRRTEETCSWRLTERQGHVRLTLAHTDDLFFDQDDSLYGLFASARKAGHALRALADEHQLCPALLGLEKVAQGKPCFASQIKRCRGVCTGQESLQDYAHRLKTALLPLRLQAWPYRGPVGLREKDVLHVIHAWSYLGTARSEEEVWEFADQRQPRFDRDVYQILTARLPLIGNRIVPLSWP